MPKKRTRKAAKLLANIEFATYSTHMSQHSPAAGQWIWNSALSTGETGNCREWVTKGLCLPTFQLPMFAVGAGGAPKWFAYLFLSCQIWQLNDQMLHSCCANSKPLILSVVCKNNSCPNSCTKMQLFQSCVLKVFST